MKEVVHIITICKDQYLVKMLRLLGGQLQLLTRGKERKGRWHSCTEGSTVRSLWHLCHHHGYMLRSGATSVKQVHKHAHTQWHAPTKEWNVVSPALILCIYCSMIQKHWALCSMSVAGCKIELKGLLSDFIMTYKVILLCQINIWSIVNKKSALKETKPIKKILWFDI